MTTCREHQWNHPCPSCLLDGRYDFQQMANRADMGRTFGSLARPVARKMQQQGYTVATRLQANGLAPAAPPSDHVEQHG